MVGSTGGTCDCGVPRTRFSTDSSVCSADGFDHYEHLCCNCLKRTLNWRYYDDDACAQCVSRKLQSMSAGWNPPLRLGDSATIPSMGYGVGTAWFKCDAERQPQLIASVQAALDAGYRHIDEAEMYANEAATGIALQQWLARNPSTPRSELFVTSKVISVDDGIEAVCRRSLAALGVSYFDLYLIHAPFQRHDGSAFQTPLPECWQQMEALVDAGLAKSIGVSNWRVADLAQIYDGARIKPSCNQVGARAEACAWCVSRAVCGQMLHFTAR